MSINKKSMHGGLPIISIIALIVIIAGGLYIYIDHQADFRAKESMMTMIEDAKKQGVELHFDKIDTTPITRSITVENFIIQGNEHDPDIILGNIVISDLDWQAFSQQQQHDQLPTSIQIEITDGKLLIDDEVIDDNPDIQSFVDVMGNELHFSSYAAYKLNQETGILTTVIQQEITDNFNIKAELSFGNAGWLAYVKTNESLLSDELTLDLLATTLNRFSITFNNHGLVETIRAVAAKKTDTSEQQQIQQTITQLRQIQTALHDYNPVYFLMVEELIKFVQQPNQLLISIDPEQPLTSDDFLKVFMGGSAPFDLMKKAQLFIRAN